MSRSSRSSRLVALGLLGACLFGLTAGISAQTLNYSPFTTTTGLTLNGAAISSGTSIELTDNMTTFQGGSFITTQRFGVAQGFDTMFDFRVNPNAAGTHADGLIFFIHGDASIADMLTGTNGGSLVYSGTLSNALVVEIDAWNNAEENDTSNNEISVHTAGPGVASADENESIGRFSPAATLFDGMLHTMRVEYVPGTLNVYLDNLTMPIISVPYDLDLGGTYLAGPSVAGLDLPDDTAWLGFAGATGGIALGAIIDAWTWTSVGPDPCFDSQVGMATGGPILDVLTVDGRDGGFFRTVDVNVLQPFTVAVAQPPGNPSPAPFAIFGTYGIPTPADAITTQFGPFCFVPSLLVPDISRFLLADSFGNHSTALVPSLPAPWTYGVPFGIPFPVQVTLQAVISEDNTNPSARAVTNGVIIDIVPNAPPIATSVMPITPSMGDVVTVIGQGFLPGATVTVGGMPVVPTTLTSTTVMFTMPNVSGCDTPVTIFNPDQQSTTATLDPSPVINNLTATSGPAAGGNILAIAGSFTPGSTVTFGGVAANVATQTPNAIVVMAPPGTSGLSVSVVVTSATGCSTTAGSTYSYM